MATLKKSLLFIGSVGEREMDVSFDVSATQSCIGADQVEGFADAKPLRWKREIRLGSERFFEPEHRVVLDFYLNGVLLSDEFFVLPSSLSSEVIIGAATLRKWRIRLNVAQNSVWVDPDAEKLMLI